MTTTSAALAAGTKLQGRYEIVRVLGFGGVSTVYLGIDRRFQSTERHCAVKEMVDAIADPAIRELSLQNFEREANVLATLNHPAVPKIFDYFQQGGRVYLVEEYIAGDDLSFVLARAKGPLPVDRVIDWALQIMDVLEYLHGHMPEPIVFRDVKPSNIMLKPDGRIMLIDFGIAKSFTGQLKGTMIGTDGYAAPEQYRGIAEPRTDIYGLGATLHHLLTASDPREHPPFSWRERPIDKLNSNVPHAVSEAIGQALGYRPEERFDSIAEFRRALQLAVAGAAAAPTRTGSLRAGSLGLYAYRPGEARRTELPTAPAIGHRESSSGLLSRLPQPTVSLPAELSEQVEGEVELLWRRDLNDEIRGTATALGDYIYVGSYDGYLYCLLASSGELLWRYKTNAGICSTPVVWGNQVFFGSEDGHVYVLNARTGAIAWSHDTGGPVRSSPAVEAGTVICGSDDGGVRAWDARSGKLIWTFQAWEKVRSTPLIHETSVFVGSHDRTFYCLDLISGKVKWKYEAGQSVVSSPALGDKLLYFGVMDGNLVALDPGSGWLAWRLRTDGPIVSTPTVAHGRVYVGSVDKCLWAIDAARGRLSWKLQTDEQVTSSPRVRGEHVYVGGIDGHVYCVDRHGKLAWKYPTGGPIPASPLLLDNQLVIGSCDHYLYALRG